MQRRRLEKWEQGSPPLETVHIWPHPATHIVSLALIVLVPIQFYSWYQDQIWMLLNGEISHPSDFGFSWGRERNSWIMVLGFLFFWCGGLAGFFFTPVHIAIKSDHIRWTSIWGFEKRYVLSAIERIEVQLMGHPRFKGEDHWVYLKFTGRKPLLIVRTYWRGADEFFALLKEQRPDLFSERYIDLIFENTGS